jgi:hypothetical protein
MVCPAGHKHRPHRLRPDQHASPRSPVAIRRPGRRRLPGGHRDRQHPRRQAKARCNAENAQARRHPGDLQTRPHRPLHERAPGPPGGPAPCPRGQPGDPHRHLRPASTAPTARPSPTRCCSRSPPWPPKWNATSSKNAPSPLLWHGEPVESPSSPSPSTWASDGPPCTAHWNPTLPRLPRRRQTEPSSRSGDAGGLQDHPIGVFGRMWAGPGRMPRGRRLGSGALVPHPGHDHPRRGGLP